MFRVPEKFRIKVGQLATTKKDGNNGLFIIPAKKYKFKLIVSQDPLWEHVSISLSCNRTPNWNEVCSIKDVFWDPSDCVMQLHPPESEYINNHPHCLHLWRPVTQQIPQPPSIMVGLKQYNLKS